MAQRRERPPLERSGQSLNVRLPGGRTMSVPVGGLTGPAESGLCCFCGQSVEQAGPDRIRLGVRWLEDGRELEQSWGAHRECLLERLHEGVKGQGPFFGQD